MVLLSRFRSEITYSVKDGYIVSRIVINDRGIKTAEAFYEEGKLHGSNRLWADDGNLKVSGQYENGMESGEWIFYRRNGTRQLSGVFLANPEFQMEDLEFIEHIVEDDIGEYMLVTSVSFQHSPPHGEWRFYDVKGRVAGIIDFEKGKVRGLHFGDVE